MSWDLHLNNTVTNLSSAELKHKIKFISNYFINLKHKKYCNTESIEPSAPLKTTNTTFHFGHLYPFPRFSQKF